MTQGLNRMIFAACRELGLDHEARRDLQLAVTSKASLSDMSEAEKKQVIARLKEDGFKPASNPRQTRGKAPRGDLRFCHVLWRLLGDAGCLRDPSRAGLNKFVRKRFGAHWSSVPADIDMLRNSDQIDEVVQALRSWCDREGVVLDRERMTR